MKYIQNILVLIGFALTMILAGCGGGGNVPSAVLKGIVTDTNGTTLASATISSGIATTTSGIDGSYTLSVPTGANRKVTASKAGRVDTFKVISLAAGQTVPMDFSLNAIGSSTSLHNLKTLPATVTDPRGAEVKLAFNTLVDSTGAAVDDATIEVTTALPSDAKFAASFPGIFIGTKAGADIPIESFGFITIKITSSTGMACNLKANTMADIAIPVTPGSDPGSQQIDLWSLDENTGKWTFVAPANRGTNGGTTVYRCSVSHFSSYNLDHPITSSMPFTITVKNSNGSTVAGASVVVTSMNQIGGGVWEGRGVTDGNGVTIFPSVPQGSVTMHALAGNQSGSWYQYDIVNNALLTTITLHQNSDPNTFVSRTFTIVYMNNGVETPIPNLTISVAQGQAGSYFVNGITNADGKTTMNIMDGIPFYTYTATTIIGGQTYSITDNVSSLAAIPAKWVLQLGNILPVVHRFFNVVYLWNGVEWPVNNVTISVSQGEINGGGDIYIHGVTNIVGEVDLNLKKGLPYYIYTATANVWANPVIGATDYADSEDIWTTGDQTYTVTGNVSSLSAIPTKWVLQ